MSKHWRRFGTSVVIALFDSDDLEELVFSELGHLVDSDNCYHCELSQRSVVIDTYQCTSIQ